jgi:hypothetical protein
MSSPKVSSACTTGPPPSRSTRWIQADAHVGMARNPNLPRDAVPRSWRWPRHRATPGTRICAVLFSMAKRSRPEDARLPACRASSSERRTATSVLAAGGSRLMRVNTCHDWGSTSTTSRLSLPAPFRNAVRGTQWMGRRSTVISFQPLAPQGSGARGRGSRISLFPFAASAYHRVTASLGLLPLHVPRQRGCQVHVLLCRQTLRSAARLDP